MNVPWCKKLHFKVGTYVIISFTFCLSGGQILKEKKMAPLGTNSFLSDWVSFFVAQRSKQEVTKFIPLCGGAPLLRMGNFLLTAY